MQYNSQKDNTTNNITQNTGKTIEKHELHYKLEMNSYASEG